jgi:hypothetical protein
MDFVVQAGTQTVLFYLEIISSLEVHPELLGHSKVAGETESRVGSDSALSVYDLVDPSRRDIDVLGQTVLTYPHRAEKFLEENLTRVDRLYFLCHAVT